MEHDGDEPNPNPMHSLLASQRAAHLAAFRATVPVLSHELYKGQCGRVAVIGGCEEYTGAPYFSAMASLKLGADLSHVICDVTAGPVIKSYSPELIVHPYLRTSDSLPLRPASPEDIVKRVADLLPRFHCVVLGPGLGRDPVMMQLARGILAAVKERGMPVVLDADALYLVAQDPNIIRGYPHAVLTPNVAEFRRLLDALRLPGDATLRDVVAQLGGVAVVEKGKVDRISQEVNGTLHAAACNEDGGLRRFGGQGDVLTGALATFLAWDRIKGGEGLSVHSMWAACAVTRMASNRAFGEHGRGTTTGAVLDALPRVFADAFDVPTAQE
ncbi:hypothetical protein H9P43_009330 [Blastocladiella emersonii ATCC 22665]|nr:hypothetical protein H9P43_009330 [Blastocladiella emersonii ATCC 22665]